MTPRQAAAALKKLPNQPPPEQPRRGRELRDACELLKSIDFFDCWERFAGWIDALRNETDGGRQVQARWLIIARDQKRRSKLGPKDVSETCPLSYFLPLLQAELLRRDAAHDRSTNRWLVKARQLREAALWEPVPAHARRLVMVAERIEKRILAWIKSEQSAASAAPAFFEFAHRLRPKASDKKTRQRQANRDQDGNPHSAIRRWSSPMSRQDYVAITGHHLRTVRRWIKKLKLKPSIRGGARNAYWKRKKQQEQKGTSACVPDRFTAQENLRMLAHWIEREAARDSKTALGLAADTVAYTFYSDHGFFEQTVDSVWPIFAARGVTREEFAHEVAAHKSLYYRPADPPSPSYEEITRALRPSGA